ncbi:hypothetical protein HPB49_020419 [Dermacentor silvarum]|uniref:Uncharacterized protein n=1 Tax=Dermacentor silvarum TaxID=543639 RepID=A0ACB8CZI5_DERSI|nr:hypothetical protein HPB49_020419 [Dermacentor silvarum]
MYRPSQTPRLTLSSEQVAQARPVPPRRETGGPSLGARSVDNSMVRFPLHRGLVTGADQMDQLREQSGNAPVTSTSSWYRRETLDMHRKSSRLSEVT